MVHVARTNRCEIVVFGARQKMLTPLVLGNGPILLNAADGDSEIQISKIVPIRAGRTEFDEDAKVVASLELGDVIRQTANLGAKYPDIVTILQAAEKQKNLPGPLVVDAVPGAQPRLCRGGHQRKRRHRQKRRRPQEGWSRGFEKRRAE